jgi:hypothetical protein
VRDRLYVLGVLNISKIGVLTNCHAFLYLEGVLHIRHVITRWYHSQQQYYNLNVYEEAELFRITDLWGSKRVFFHSRQTISEYVIPKANTIPYDQIRGKKLTAMFAADNGNTPTKHFSDTIENIEKVAVSK